MNPSDVNKSMVMHLTYQGVMAKITWSEEDGCWVGHSINTQGIHIAFHSDSLDDIGMRFAELVDDCMDEIQSILTDVPLPA